MADVTTIQSRNLDLHHNRDEGILYISGSQTKASDDDIILTEDGETDADSLDLGAFPHVFIGIELLAADNGAQSTASAGTFTIHVQTYNSKFWEPIPSNTITAATQVTRSWSGNTYAIRVSPASLDVATHWRIVVTGNRT